jgi:NAD-dependent dihydropyrimidine dehydrogenase PreA subunit
MLKSISQKIRASCFAIISARFLSTRSGNSGVLLREWITDSLYHPQKGYFTKHAQILTPVPQDQDIEIFSSFSSRKDYLRWLKRVFRHQKHQGCWRTPSELFGPLYVNAIARYVTTLYRKNSYQKPLHIIEFGAGKGACAEYFLQYLAQNEPQLYSAVKYECVEISQRFAAHLKSFLVPRHGTRVVVHHKDCLSWNQLCDEECFVIALEVDVKRTLSITQNISQYFVTRML